MALVFRIPADLQVFSAGCQTFQVTSRVALKTNRRSLKVLDFHVSGISSDPKWSYNHAMLCSVVKLDIQVSSSFSQMLLWAEVWCRGEALTLQLVLPNQGQRVSPPPRLPVTSAFTLSSKLDAGVTWPLS